MANIVAVLQEGLTADKIFAVVGQVIPVALQLVPVALGLTVIRRVVKGASKAKVRF